MITLNQIREAKNLALVLTISVVSVQATAQVSLTQYGLARTVDPDTHTLGALYDYEAPWGLATTYSCSTSNVHSVEVRHYKSEGYISAGGSKNGKFRKGCDSLCRQTLRALDVDEKGKFLNFHPKAQGYRSKALAPPAAMALWKREMRKALDTMDLTNEGRKQAAAENHELLAKWGGLCGF